MINKINSYVFLQIIKSCTIIFFIFLSIAWLLQLTRLFTLTNLVQIDVINVIYLSFFLIPNLLTIITPFIIIFGILLCFIKLSKDKEIIAIFSLGLQLKPIKYSLTLFTFFIVLFSIVLNFYFSPKIYEQYKIKEFELRNTINFDRMIISNFLKLNENTIIDFKKNNNIYEDIFINFNDEKENIIFAKKGFIKNNKNQYIFQLYDGFKLTLNNDDEIEKLEFENYILNIKNENSIKFSNFDRNTFTIFDDLITKNYLNISFKIIDILISIFIIYFFYLNNITKINFSLKNNILFILISVLILIINQLLKNTEINLLIYCILSICLISSVLLYDFIRKKYE